MDSIMDGRPVCDGYHDDPENWRCQDCAIKAQQIPANPQEIENARAEVLRALRPIPGYRRSELTASVLSNVAHITKYPDSQVHFAFQQFAKEHGVPELLRVMADVIEAQR